MELGREDHWRPSREDTLKAGSVHWLIEVREETPDIRPDDLPAGDTCPVLEATVPIEHNEIPSENW